MIERDKAILKKTKEIFMSNVYPSDRYPWGKYRMIAPSRNGGFPGIWNWDSAFHAIGMLRIDTDIAKEQILGFLQFQKENGLLPDVIWENGKIEDRFGKPPVMAWAALQVYKKTEDIDFLRTIYPKLVLNEKFWVENRKYGNLFHYDAEQSADCDKDTYHLLVSYESGWDEHPRWDKDPQNIWPIDLNSYMIMTYAALSEMAGILGADRKTWIEKREELIVAVEKMLWNEELQSYSDYNFKDKNYIDVLSPASFIPLFAGFASKERAEKMNEIARLKFMPCMPMVAFDSPQFDTEAYCRGACWLHMAYMAAKGLKKYGFCETSEMIKETILEWVYLDNNNVHENYNAITGEGKCNPRFSWRCVFAREFILNF